MPTYGRYVWSRAATPTVVPPLVPEIDPEHVRPSADLAGRQPFWENSAPAPLLPPEVEGGEPPSPVGGGGPIDHTPTTHDAGIAGMHPQTVLEAQETRYRAMSQDMGAVAARAWQAKTMRSPHGPQVAILDDDDGQGDSPQTLQLQRTGVGQPNDPHARVGKRLQRWWNLIWDMHWFEPAYRPMPIRYATTAEESGPPMAGASQYDSPYVSPAPFRATPDQFVLPAERRTPRPWDEASTQDTGGNPFGLTTWGL